MLPYHTKITKYLFIIFIIGILAYAYFEAGGMLQGPIINIGSPAAGYTVQSELVEITGTALRVTEILLDGRPIQVNEQGEFSEKLLLSPGVNTFTFVAKDKFDREQQESLQIFYDEPYKPQ